MVASVARTPRPRVGLDAAAPLFQRWQRMQQRVLAEIPEGNPLRGTANLMCAERSIDQMEDAIAEARHQQATAALPPDVDSPQRRAVCDALATMQQQYQPLAVKIAQAQKYQLPSWAADPVLRFMGLVSANVFTTLPPPAKWGWDCWTPTSQLKELVTDWQRYMNLAREIDGVISAIELFKNHPAGERAWQAVQVVVTRGLPAIADRLEAIEAQLSAIEARLNPPRKKKLKLGKASQRQTTKQQEIRQ